MLIRVALVVRFYISMTRELSEILGAREPAFRLGLRQLEQTSGNPNEDIRLSSRVHRQVQEAIRALGLDPYDTTGPELYGALMARLEKDDAALADVLGTTDKTVNLMTRTQRLLQKLDIPRSVFAVKTTAIKAIIKKSPPKKAMKQLGYRSIDSMLKHEHPALILAAASIAETRQWHSSLVNRYKKLKPTNFEVRDVTIVAPNNKKWVQLAKPFVEKHQHNILKFDELGAVILLPIEPDRLRGTALATLLIALQEINEVRSVSAFLKLNQVRPDFGELVAESVRDDPFMNSRLANERLPWKLVQHYFGRPDLDEIPDTFEPHVQPEDLQPVSIEAVLAGLSPRFEFWKKTSDAGYLYNNQPVSLNLTDAALNFCNQLPFERRIMTYLREHLWRELMLRYMKRESVEAAVQKQLGEAVADERLVA